MAMVEAGILDAHERVELVDGVLVEMSPIGPRHDEVVEWLTRHFVKASGDAFRVRVQSTFLTPGGGFFEPDIIVFAAIPRGRHPDAALLVVEVAYTSHAWDARKAATYAAAGVHEYWIVDVKGDELLVHRSPAGDTYASVERFVPGDLVTPLIDAPPVDVAALLAH